MPSTSNAQIPNRYKRAPNAIAYNVVKVAGGWRVEAHFPKRISPQDRLIVLKWFQDYRNQVRQSNPLWVTYFSSHADAYFLDVRPVASPKELIEKCQYPKQIWMDEIANRA